MRDLLGGDADALLQKRFSVINVWRPIRGPVQDTPLAVSDARSIDDQDLVATDLVYPDRTGEIYYVKFNPAHKWFYAPAMRDDEIMLIKCYDSAEDGRARFVPHSAFVDPTTPAGAPPRESIELRTLVFYDYMRHFAAMNRPRSLLSPPGANSTSAPAQEYLRSMAPGQEKVAPAESRSCRVVGRRMREIALIIRDSNLQVGPTHLRGCLDRTAAQSDHLCRQLDCCIGKRLLGVPARRLDGRRFGLAQCAKANLDRERTWRRPGGRTHRRRPRQDSC